jgi:4-hydroxy-tetrahydrodipicolinate reductase
VKILLFGPRGKVGCVLGPKLVEAGHEVTPIDRGDAPTYEGQEAAVDFTRPDAARANVEGCLAAGIACVVGTTGLTPDDLDAFDSRSRESGVACFVAPNFALGAVLMMRFAAEVGRHMPRAEIVELHDERKVDAPSGTAKATAAALPGDVPIHSVRLPGLVAHQEVLLGGLGETLTIRHDSLSRESFMPGVVMAVRAVPGRPGLTLGLEPILFGD